MIISIKTFQFLGCIVFLSTYQVIPAELIPDPKRFDKIFKDYRKSDQESFPKQDKLVLFTGSSSIRLWKNLPSSFPKVNTLNRGFGGAHLSDVLHFYDSLFPLYRPEQIVLYCGENDLWSGKPVDQVFDAFSKLWRKISIDLPNSTLIYLSCKPSPKRISKWSVYQSLNRRVESFCNADSKLTFVDLSSTLLKVDMTFYDGLWSDDNLHVNNKGYYKWTLKIRPLLIQKPISQ